MPATRLEEVRTSAKAAAEADSDTAGTTRRGRHGGDDTAGTTKASVLDHLAICMLKASLAKTG